MRGRVQALCAAVFEVAEIQEQMRAIVQRASEQADRGSGGYIQDTEVIIYPRVESVE